jgi:hypothetical protein
MRCTPMDKRDERVIEALVDAVGDRAVGEERGKRTAAVLQQRGVALHVQIGLLLAGEARIRQILRRGAAAHRDIERQLLEHR